MKPWQQGAALLALAVLVAVTQLPDDDPVPGRAPIDLASPAVDGAVALPAPSGPDVWTGRVVRVSDGDTLVVDVVSAADELDLQAGQEVKVRLLRIDTPELAREDQPLECWATEAARALEELAPRDSVLTFQYDEERIDQYGRDLAHAWTEGGIWINGRMLLDGHARVATYRPNTAHDDRVHNLETIAREARAGRWGNCAA